MSKGVEKKMELAQTKKKSISKLSKAKVNLEVELQKKTLRLRKPEKNLEYLFKRSLYFIF